MLIMIFLAKNNTVKELKTSGKTETKIGEHRYARYFFSVFWSMRFIIRRRLNTKRYVQEGLWKQAWVVFAKRTFGSSKSVVEYLGRYSHKIAISNHRIRSIDDQNVVFSYKDYRQYGQKKTMQLGHGEFIRRFALHILPKGFVKIRHYGFLSSTWKRSKLKLLQDNLGVKLIERAGKKPFLPKCTWCKIGNLHPIVVFDNRGPPPWYIGASQNTFPCLAN